MKPGSVLLLHSTIRPSTCRHIRAQAVAQGVEVLDAPVSGSGEAALNKTLLVMVGGAAEALDRARPVLECFAHRIMHLGPVGDGQVAKLINNLLYIASINLARTALSWGEDHGLNRDTLRDLMLAGSGRSFALASIDERIVPSNAEHVRMLFAKDIALAQELALKAGPPLGALAEQALATLDFLKELEGAAE
jgi:3-hydroxyisobutyrate dehydrogenase-like beta-hydroxyacid dehydrogenase